MTIKEFASKYKIPYYIAYEATYHVQPIATMIRDMDFPEDELFNAASDLIEDRANKHAKLLSQANRMFINLHSTRAKEDSHYDLPKVRRENTDD